MSVRKIGEQEAVEILLDILRNAKGPLTTWEIEEKTKKLSVACPDSTPIFLNRLRIQGIIEGQLSKEKRGWVWWVKQ